MFGHGSKDYLKPESKELDRVYKTIDVRLDEILEDFCNTYQCEKESITSNERLNGLKEHYKKRYRDEFLSLKDESHTGMLLFDSRAFLDRMEDDKLSYATYGSACFDLRAFYKVPYMVQYVSSDDTKPIVIGTGLYILVPSYYDNDSYPKKQKHYIKIYSKSGLASKGIIVTNAPGIVDNDYKGEIKVILSNLYPHSYKIHNNDKIAQAEICPCNNDRRVFYGYGEKLEDLSASDAKNSRQGGFGSTGKQ